MGRLINVRMPDKKSGVSSWCREVTDTAEQVKSGYDIEGEWLDRGEVVEVNSDSPILCVDQRLSRDDPEATLYRVKAGPTSRVGKLDQVEHVRSRGWARILGPIIQRMLTRRTECCGS